MARFGGRRAPALSVAVVVVVVALAAACSGTSNVSQATPSTANPPSATAHPTPVKPGPTQPAPTPARPATSASGKIDPGLLLILPATVGGRAVEEFPEIEAQLAANELVRLFADGIAVATLSDPGGAVTVITVLRLTGLGKGDAAYASYRENYDRSACENIGGLGSATATSIAGRPVDRTECLGGATILHLRVRDDTVVISILAVGQADIAEEIVANLRP